MSVAVASCSALLATTDVSAQVDPPPPGTDSVVAVPGAGYGAAWLHRTFMGGGYRDLWTTGIKVPVADLSRLGGGLTPLREGGGVSTRTLHMTGEDGRRYVLRSVAKSPGDLAVDLEGTPAAAILQDQVSSFHPSGAPVVARLLAELDVLHPDPRYMVIPDDPRLEEFQGEFAGMLALFEERPDDRDGEPGFAGSRQIVQLERLFEILEEEPDNRVDVLSLLRSRMVDLMVGDRDRSHNNHLWARIDDGASGSIWRVIPRDRDQAFVRFDGILKALARSYDPRLVSFSDAYPNILGLTRNAWDMDRNLLVGVDRTTWDDEVQEVKDRLTDDVIAEAVARMPAEHFALSGEQLIQSLKLRRDFLHEAADRLYEVVFGTADIHASDASEEVRIVREVGGAVAIAVEPLGGNGPTFARTFDPAETAEIRLYMHGGDDVALLSGAGSTPIRLRLVGGGGRDSFRESSGGSGPSVIVYDQGADTEVVPGMRLEATGAPRPYSWFEETRDLDWGARTGTGVRGGYDQDRGLVLLGRFSFYRYGFLKDPYQSRTRLLAGWAFARNEPVVDVLHISRAAIGSADFRVSGRWSGVEILDYYGQGNEVGVAGPTSFHRVTHRQITVAPAIGMGDGEETYVEFGPILRYTSTDTTSAASFLAGIDPYGSGDFAQAGLQVSFQADTRDNAGTPGRGYFLEGGTSFYPSLLDVERGAFGEVHGQVATYLSPGSGNPTLAVRAGGKKVWGPFPFAESAFLGGASDLRGLREQRYAGSGSLYGSAELRVFVTRLVLVLPMDIGLFGLADVGRVYASGDASSLWHRGFGGGIWLAPLRRSSTVQVSLARSEGRTGVYVGMGFAF